MNRTIVLASRNAHKVREIRSILREINATVLSLEDFPDIPEIPETGESFAENALIKARAVFEHTGLWTLSDDSGLEVDALGGAPGVYSARFAGRERDYAANNRKLLEALQGIPPERRTARFRCVVAIVGPGVERTVEGVVEGRIIEELRGSGGFGYDPLFVPEGYEQTFAELGEAVKNHISHRARAFRKAGKVVQELWEKLERMGK